MDEVVTSWGVDTTTGQQVVGSSQEEVLDSKLKRKMTQASTPKLDELMQAMPCYLANSAQDQRHSTHCNAAPGASAYHWMGSAHPGRVLPCISQLLTSDGGIVLLNEGFMSSLQQMLISPCNPEVHGRTSKAG